MHKITIISRGHAAGYTLKLPTEERQFHTRKEFLDDITVSLGGYAAEVMMFDDLTTGPSNDLQVATGLAHDMVAKYGMSSGIGPIAFEASGMMIARGGFIEKEYSQDVAMRIDKEVEKIMNEGLRRAQELLTKHRHVLDAIAAELLRVTSRLKPLRKLPRRSRTKQLKVYLTANQAERGHRENRRKNKKKEENIPNSEDVRIDSLFVSDRQKRVKFFGGSL